MIGGLGTLAAATVLALLGGASAPAAELVPPGPIPLRLTAIGDVNFNQDREPVYPDRVEVYGKAFPFEHFTGGIAPLLDGHVNFANLETVVTDRNDLEPPRRDKPFCFRSHPNGVRALMDAGVNLLSLANNHAFDYGAPGVEETLAWIGRLGAGGRLAGAGLGRTKAEALRPAVLEVAGVRVGLVAVTIGAFASERRPGPASLAHTREALALLRDADVDLRVLSVHAGTNRTVVPDRRQVLWPRVAIRDYGVDLVLMHHPHRVQGIERYRHGLVFYGLGNGAMRGASDLGANPALAGREDFGLLARLDLVVDRAAGTVRFRRLEAIPLYAMHDRPRPLPPDEAARRVAVVNELSRYEVLDRACYGRCPPPDRAEPLVLVPRGLGGVADLDPAPAVASP